MTFGRYGRIYVAHGEPRTAAANLVAIVIAANQPFYPLFVGWTVSTVIWPTFFTFLSTPLFLAVPAVSRRSPVLGRAMLVLVGIANTVLCAKLLGPSSGVEMFLLPCVMLSAMLFGGGERWIMLASIGLALALFLGLHDGYGTPAHVYTPEEYNRFLRLHGISVASLVAFLGFLLSNLGEAAARPASAYRQPGKERGNGETE